MATKEALIRPVVTAQINHAIRQTGAMHKCAAGKAKKRIILLLSFLCLSLPFLTACNSAMGTQSQGGEQLPSAAADYCVQSGGTVETRYPFYGTNSDKATQLAGSLDVCTFTAEDESRILIGLDTLYTDQPTLAAVAYRAKLPFESDAPASANPSSLYCTQLGGTDTFGGVDAAGGGWGLENGTDIIALCVFPDLSVIDSWGITYYSNGTVRGADLNDLLRFSE